MLSTSWSAAPAGFAGEGVVVRPYAADRARVRPDLGGLAVAVRGTSVPTAGPALSGPAVRHRGTGLTTTGMPTATQFAPLSQFDPIPQQDSTLGLHRSGRPLS